MRRLISIVCVIIGITVAAGCSNASAVNYLSEDEMTKIIENLVEEMAKADDIILGNVEYEDKVYFSTEDGAYAYKIVNDERVDSVTAVKDIVNRVYSTSYITVNLSEFSYSKKWQPSDMYYQREGHLLVNIVYNRQEPTEYYADDAAFSSVSEDSFTATIKYKNSDNYIVPVDISVIQENGIWKVNSFN